MDVYCSLVCGQAPFVRSLDGFDFRQCPNSEHAEIQTVQSSDFGLIGISDVRYLALHCKFIKMILFQDVRFAFTTQRSSFLFDGPCPPDAWSAARKETSGWIGSNSLPTFSLGTKILDRSQLTILPKHSRHTSGLKLQHVMSWKSVSVWNMNYSEWPKSGRPKSGFIPKVKLWYPVIRQFLASKKRTF